MHLFNQFKPTWMVESIFNISPEELKKYQFKAILADLDNTLVAWDTSNYDDVIIQWIKKIKKRGIPVLILSNNSEERIQPLADSLNIPYISSAYKPLPYGFDEGLKQLSLNKNEVLMVGDQLMTDIFGGNMFGLDTVLVKPIVSTDAGTTKINRKIESLILKTLIKNNDDMKWRHSLDEPIKPPNN